MKTKVLNKFNIWSFEASKKWTPSGELQLLQLLQTLRQCYSCLGSGQNYSLPVFMGLYLIVLYHLKCFFLRPFVWKQKLQSCFYPKAASLSCSLREYRSRAFVPSVTFTHHVGVSILRRRLRHAAAMCSLFWLAEILLLLKKDNTAHSWRREIYHPPHNAGYESRYLCCPPQLRN